MVPIPVLWLPILLSAVAVFVLSSLIHMLLGYHANDMKRLPDEDAAANALRSLNIPPGLYVMPHASSPKDMGSAEFKEKIRKGPRALLHIWTQQDTSMTSSLLQWFVYTVVVSVFVAYVAGRALHPAAPYLAVFKFAGVTSFIGYVVAGWQETIWYKRPWSTSIKNTIDGVIYAAATAAIFGWLWPVSAL